MHISCPNLFDPDIQVNRKTKRALGRYLGGLMLYPGKKNCSSIANATNVSHDIVYDFFECHVEEKEILQSFLKKAFYALPLEMGTWYANIDETMIDKMFSEKIEAVAYNWSSTFCDTMKGFSIVAAVITNGKITIPITFKTWYSEKDYPDKHKTRIELAQVLMIEIHKIVPGIMFLMDGAFSSEGMIGFCRTHKMKYCMRFHSNKKVLINGEVAQIRKHERIKISTNKRGRVVKGYYKGEEVFLGALKKSFVLPSNTLVLEIVRLVAHQSKRSTFLPFLSPMHSSRSKKITIEQKIRSRFCIKFDVANLANCAINSKVFAGKHDVEFYALA